MRVFWSVLAVIALSATEALAANWNKATVYPPESLVDQLKRGTVWQRELGEPERAPIVLAEARSRPNAVPPVLQAPPSTVAGASSLAPGAVAAIRNIASVCGSSTGT